MSGHPVIDPQVQVQVAHRVALDQVWPLSASTVRGKDRILNRKVPLTVTHHRDLVRQRLGQDGVDPRLVAHRPVLQADRAVLANRHELGRLESVVVVLDLPALGRNSDPIDGRIDRRHRDQTAPKAAGFHDALLDFRIHAVGRGRLVEPRAVDRGSGEV